MVVYVQFAFQGRPHKQAEIKARPRPVKRQPLDDDVKAPGRLQTGENWLPRHGRREGDTPCVRITIAPNLIHQKVYGCNWPFEICGGVGKSPKTPHTLSKCLPITIISASTTVITSTGHLVRLRLRSACRKCSRAALRRSWGWTK